VAVTVTAVMVVVVVIKVYGPADSPQNTFCTSVPSILL